MSFLEQRSNPQPDLPRLRSDLRVDVVSDREVLVMNGSERYIFESAALVSILPLLNGKNTVIDIAEELSGELSLRDVLRTVGSMNEGGYLVEGAASADVAETAWFDQLGVGPVVGIPRIEAAKVTPHSVGGIDLGRVSSDLAEAGLNVTESADTDIDVVLCDDYLNPELEQHNARSLTNERPWLLASPARAQLWLGPLMVPNVTGCWVCLQQRLAGNRQMERYVQRVKGVNWANPSVPAGTSLIAGAASGMIATEVSRVIAGGLTHPGLLGRVVTLDLLSWESEPHVLVRQPQCRACGEPERYRSDRPVELTAQNMVAGIDSGHRIVDPAETVANLEHHVSAITGAISSLYRFEAADSEVSHNYAAGHNFAMMSNSTYLLRKNMRGLSGGKGRTDVQAKASALCEAIERYSGVWRGDEVVRRASEVDLGDAGLNLQEILGFSDEQYRNRLEWNREQASGIHLVPERLDPERVVDWTQVWSLTNNQPRWVPSAYCYFGHPDMEAGPFCFSDANGNAAGNTLEEAILQGALELVERDAVAIWWYNRMKVGEVILDSVEDPYTDRLLEFYASMDRDLRLLDLTTDLGIPSFAAVSRRLGHPVEDPLLGFGAHVEPRLAALRALTECNQFLPGVSARYMAGDTEYLFDDGETLEWFTTATFETEPYLVPSEERRASDVRQMIDHSSNDIKEEIETCVEIFRRAGLEMFVLDQSRPDLDIKVAKVIVPGLRHFWRRLGPGRLFDVPVQLGALSEPLLESSLNPKSVFF